METGDRITNKDLAIYSVFSTTAMLLLCKHVTEQTGKQTSLPNETSHYLSRIPIIFKSRTRKKNKNKNNKTKHISNTQIPKYGIEKR